MNELTVLIGRSSAISDQARDALRDVVDTCSVAGNSAMVFRDRIGDPEPTPEDFRQHELNQLARNVDDGPIRNAKKAIRTALDLLPVYGQLYTKNTLENAFEITRGAVPIATQQAKGEKPKSNTTTESILPVLLSAFDIAIRIGRKRESVTSFLTRFAERNPECRIENATKRKNEPGYLYRTTDVWPALERWMKDNPAK